MFQFLAATNIKIEGPLPNATADEARLQTIVNVFFSILGAAALLIIVIAGLRYINARGDPGATAKAQSTVAYTSVGLAIALVAYGIVTFALNNL